MVNIFNNFHNQHSRDEEFKGFNFNNECDCDECNSHQNIEYSFSEVHFIDPNSAIINYVELLKGATCEEDLYEILHSFYHEIDINSSKKTLYELARLNMDAINQLEKNDNKF